MREFRYADVPLIKSNGFHDSLLGAGLVLILIL